SAAAALVPDPSGLATGIVWLLVLVFFLYLIWDLLGIWMAKSELDGKPRYPDVRDNVTTDNRIIDDSKQQLPEKAGLTITFTGFVLLLILGMLKHCAVNSITPNRTFATTIVLLLGYRTAKETRTSWR